jgi:hypothetical protein
LAHVPAIASGWANAEAAHAEPVKPNAKQVALAILQDAADIAHQRKLADALDGSGVSVAKGSKTRPFLQAAFCIDVRSEV